MNFYYVFLCIRAPGLKTMVKAYVPMTFLKQHTIDTSTQLHARTVAPVL
jgi:hypothetical protein